MLQSKFIKSLKKSLPKNGTGHKRFDSYDLKLNQNKMFTKIQNSHHILKWEIRITKQYFPVLSKSFYKVHD